MVDLEVGLLALCGLVDVGPRLNRRGFFVDGQVFSFLPPRENTDHDHLGCVEGLVLADGS